MYTLFIDTHYKDVLLYLFKDKNLLNKKEIVNVKSTSVETMPNIVSLLCENDIDIHLINRIAVCVGPGSFTGTRIGVTIAKTMAYSLNVPIVTLTSIDLIGMNISEESFVAVKENNGYFIALYNDGIIGEIKYLKNSDYDVFKKNNKVIENNNINETKLIDVINKMDIKNVHDVNPIYVKSIEALK